MSSTNSAEVLKNENFEIKESDKKFLGIRRCTAVMLFNAIEKDRKNKVYEEQIRPVNKDDLNSFRSTLRRQTERPKIMYFSYARP